MKPPSGKFPALVALTMSAALVLTACGGGDSGDAADAVEAPQEVSAPASEDVAAPQSGPVVDGAAPVGAVAPGAAPVTAPVTGAGGPAAQGTDTKNKAKAPAASDSGKSAKNETSASGSAGITAIDNAAQAAENKKIAEQKGYATDIGVTKDSIKMGTVAMQGVALGNLFIKPLVEGIQATFAAMNDRGGVLGRRLSLVACDDGPGEVSRSKACIKKLAGQDKVFALLGYTSWASASVHSDLAQYKLPAIGTWGYSQTEWQDPYMFPTHMSMIHESMANAHWVKNVIKPKTYGLICLTSPEMQLACNEVQKILDASGSKLVKKVDVGIAETSMSAQVLSLRSANPEHIVHYVINPATMAKFMVEAAQQNYYPSKGISGNHLAAEVLGSIFGKHPAGRYWTNTTFKLWGSQFISLMNKYSRGNRGLNHHITQAAYFGALIFERAATAVGPNLTRERLMAQMGNGDIYAVDAELGQQFGYDKAERGGSSDNQTWNPNSGQGHEYIYKYEDSNTVSNPDGSPNGFQPDPDQFEIYTNK